MLRLKEIKGELKKSSLFLLFTFLFTFQLNGFAQISFIEAFPQLEFSLPIDLQHSPDSTNRLFVVEQEGIIRVFENSPSVTESKIFLDIRDQVKQGGEMGLLGLAFHPDYKNNGYFYVNYTTGSPNDRSIVSRFQVSSDPDSADVASELRLLRLDQPEDNHNGGQLAFGPDGYLYIAFGDGGGAGDPSNNAQRRNTFLGKILRIDVDSSDGTLNYRIPKDNPFILDSGAKGEIFAYGFRNPWRFSFDALTGKIWCGDVGQGEWEEINIVEPGGNYGWRIKEGHHCFNPSQDCDTAQGLIAPIWEYSHSSGDGYSVTGGYVYRGSGIPELYGKYIYGDYITGKVWGISNDTLNGPINELLITAPGSITSFGVDQNQELYACVFAEDNKIYKLSKISGAEESGRIIMDYNLSNAYPNPFNPNTTINFTIPSESRVKIEVISITGEVIDILKNEVISEGKHKLIWNAEDIPSGIYFIRLISVSESNTDIYNNTIKVVFLK